MSVPEILSPLPLRLSGCRLGLSPGAVAFLMGCAIGPDYKRPEAATIPAAYAGATNGWKIAHPQAQLPRGNWWELFGEPELSALETQASTANQQLKAAFDRFEQARAAMHATRARLLPNLSASGSSTGERTSPSTPSVTTC